MDQNEKINEIKELAIEINSYFSSEDKLIAKVNTTSNDYLKKLLEWYKPGNDSIQPVNLFRYVLATKLLNGERLTTALYNSIKEKLERRDLTEFDFLTDRTKELLQNYPQKTKSFFVQWSNPARILFPFYYTEDLANRVFKNLTEIGNQIIADLNLKEVGLHVVDFPGSQNYGGDVVWLAIYPKDKKDHRQSFQLFSRVNSEGLFGGIAKGSSVEDDNYVNDFTKINSFAELTPLLKTKVATWQELNQGILEATVDTISDTKTNLLDMNPNALNKILFGPPGTGKTYHTVSEAIKVVDPDFYGNNSNNREKLQKRFNELLIRDWKNPEGQIAFCTFHQSFSYEDFVEGIKPKTTNDKQVYYEIEDGIFKSICRKADAINNAQTLAKDNLVSLSQTEFNQAVFYKISLGDSTKAYGKEVYEYCIKNNVISIGFGEDIDFTDKSEEDINNMVTQNQLAGHAAQSINYFKNYLKVGNYVVVSNGNSYIRALGKVVGEYKFEDETEIGFNHFRKVEWIFKDVEIPVTEFYQSSLMQKTIYKLKKEFILPSFFVKAEKKAEVIKETKNFVIVIDEINRGNVSSIFGELITLIEPSKRAGKLEALEVVLPYSKEKFTIPSNVYVIGTMNTADRSIESLDTALRRRFSFKEMAPKSGLIKTEGASKGSIDGIDLVRMLDKINERIEKLIDKDHKIGHSYFINVVSGDDLRLAFHDKVIPLLEEYFFGDFGKIGLVLGSSFVKKQPNDFEFAKFEEYDSQTEQDLKSRAIYTIKPIAEWNFKSIYE